MKDMGRCGNVAFCAMVLFYCSFITGDYLCVSSAEVSSSAHSSVKRRNGVTDANMTSTPDSVQTQSPSNITNSTEATSHTITVMLVNSSAPAENTSFSENITDISNISEVSPVNNKTAVSMVKPTTHPPSMGHEPTSSIHLSTLHPTYTRPSTKMTASSGPVRAKTQADTPSALNVGDGGNSKSSTDPLLAGLVSAFVVVAAIVSVLVFLKFRRTNEGPEFRRLQDLPMDDMLEDAPLSMYSY
ncbi:uncharacterized protein LOC122324706 [Puntigrus tetrazona]|uniref:uncharacterized protein LOC122324706 n=1 Tax=Puntigrus tetrazona TaxID=1606681 RepID=UPI001C89E610|nr:uncharacterized protein LOC122324706 [Puntigrus tetrazona]